MAWKSLGWPDLAQLRSDVPQLMSRRVISLSEREQMWRHSPEQPHCSLSPSVLLPGRMLTLSSKVKQTRCGYSLSAITTPASPSFRTYTWQRYSGQRIYVRKAVGRSRACPSTCYLLPGPSSSSTTHKLPWEVSFSDCISHAFIRRAGRAQGRIKISPTLRFSWLQQPGHMTWDMTLAFQGSRYCQS